MQRLDRILSEAGVASRKELRAIIRAGRVTADGAVVTDESRKFDEAAVHIAVDGRPVRLRGPVLIMLHKPAGYLTAADDPKAKTIMELVPDEYRRSGGGWKRWGGWPRPMPAGRDRPRRSRRSRNRKRCIIWRLSAPSPRPRRRR